jgi:ion channel-forming bestrophin family protein
MGNVFYDSAGVSQSERQADLERLSKCTWAFVRSMKRHLSPEWEDEASFRLELLERLPESQANAIINASHRPNRALYDLSMAIENIPMHFMRKNEMHKALTIFEDNLGSSERLLTSPVPLIYNRHTARFLTIWLLFLPAALYDPFQATWNHIGVIPCTAILSLFLFGIEELATQMEEPFTILPMQAFCDKIDNWCNEIVSWEDGDNGIFTKKNCQGRYNLYFDEYNMCQTLPPESYKNFNDINFFATNGGTVVGTVAASVAGANPSKNWSTVRSRLVVTPTNSTHTNNTSSLLM